MCDVSRVGRRAGLLRTGRWGCDRTGGDLLPRAPARPTPPGARRHSSEALGPGRGPSSHREGAYQPGSAPRRSPPARPWRLRLSQRDQSPCRGGHGDRGRPGWPSANRAHVLAERTGLTSCLQSARGSRVMSVEPAWGSRVCRAHGAGATCPQSPQGAHASVAPSLPGHAPMCAAPSSPATQLRC